MHAADRCKDGRHLHGLGLGTARHLPKFLTALGILDEVRSHPAMAGMDERMSNVVSGGFGPTITAL